ncbi:hypothetical protein IMZ48_07170 [Candidatus Bathyarchaeota archaeon]|nr:hypothetical protein [Candidatus Bathyarchaeota archaeon]
MAVAPRASAQSGAIHIHMVGLTAYTTGGDGRWGFEKSQERRLVTL